MPTNAKFDDRNTQAKIVKMDKKPADLTEKKPKQVYDPEDLIFSLDIGTRTIVGIVGIQENDKFKVVATEVLEHKHRAMLDGQIHDISKVAEATKEIKERLEKTLGFTLNKVAIAAAGRTLKTCNIKIDREIEQGKEITQDMVSSIEMEGIQQAQFKLDADIINNEKTQFYCVGYSVINYFLNGYVMSSLIGHRGNSIGVEILATFLPHIVVDSLYTVMNRVGLEVISLTLEPIAAINVAIPKNLRLLNLALVDIGAGTSDIALTKDGSVFAYAMAPVAGDEITEKIIQHYLVDFNIAEKIKTSLSGKSDSVTFTDILGKKKSVSVVEVLEILQSSIEHLANIISEKILEYNQKSPSAVFLIGGGSQIPGLTNFLAEYLQLPEDRVVVRGRDIIQNIKISGKKLSGPEAITPFGIAITAQMQRGQDFLAVTINGKKVRLFNSRSLAVADALILVGFNPRELIGSTGKSITFELNGQKKIVRGEYGKAAEIFVNEQVANLETVLRIGDDIRVIPAEDGKNAVARVGNFVKEINPIKIYYNANIIDAGTSVLINGKAVNEDKEIKNGDSVEISEINTVKDLMRVCEINRDVFHILVNGLEVTDDYKLKSMDKVECKIKEAKPEQAYSSNEDDEIEIVDISTGSIKETPIDICLTNNTNNFGASVIINGKAVMLKNDKKQHIFVDVFEYIDFDLTRPQGNIVLKLNGKPAGFTDVIKSGDVIDIYWEKS